jgi:6-phosphogluconolactonase
MEQYVAYVGTYTHGSSRGIHIYDIEPATWKMRERKVVPINNPSDIVVSKDRRFLYSIADEGVRSFRIQKDGDLQPLNAAWTGAMRGTDLEISKDGKYLFVGGYHDGSVSVLHVNEDGSIGAIADNVFHENTTKGLTKSASAPHVTCIRQLPDEAGFAAVDSGLDHVKIYHIQPKTGKLKLHDILRLEINSSPIVIRFSADGRFSYLLSEADNTITVFHLGTDKDGFNTFETIQKIPCSEEKDFHSIAACSMELTMGGKHLLVGNNGTNTMSVFNVDLNTGLLNKLFENRTSGSYPKALGLMPDNRHVAVLAHDTNEIISLYMNYPKNYFLMDAKPIRVEQPNCIAICKLL